MEDVAKRLGVAKGTLYGYTQGKEALFDAALRYCDGLETLPQPSELPLPIPKSGATAIYLSERVTEESKQLLLAKAVFDVEGSSTLDLAQVCLDLYQHIYRNRHSIKLIDRCALDHPELAKILVRKWALGSTRAPDAVLGARNPWRVVCGRYLTFLSLPG